MSNDEIEVQGSTEEIVEKVRDFLESHQQGAIDRPRPVYLVSVSTGSMRMRAVGLADMLLREESRRVMVVDDVQVARPSFVALMKEEMERSFLTAEILPPTNKPWYRNHSGPRRSSRW